MLVLLAFLAYGLNRLGDKAMPHVSEAVGHFGNAIVDWSFEYAGGDWRQVQCDFREVTGIRRRSPQVGGSEEGDGGGRHSVCAR